jgi:hypothetical protein
MGTSAAVSSRTPSHSIAVIFSNVEGSKLPKRCTSSCLVVRKKETFLSTNQRNLFTFADYMMMRKLQDIVLTLLGLKSLIINRFILQQIMAALHSKVI